MDRIDIPMTQPSYDAKLDLEGWIEETTIELEELSKKTGMPITLENGQRRYGPLPGAVAPPIKGTEVFVGRLPRDCIETELLPVFEKVGKIYEMRMMMDFSGTNRGYCFIQYFTSTEAEKAVKDLNHFELRSGRRIGVKLSVDNCRLFIGSIPREKTQDEIFDEMTKVTEHVVRVIYYPSSRNKSKNRGFAFVEYKSHKAAANARRKLIPGKIQLWGQDVEVDWAEPEGPHVKALYVRHLSESTSEETLLKVFNDASNNRVEKLILLNGFAFIHFASREVAEQAKKALDKTQIDGAEVEILWRSKPKPIDLNLNSNQRGHPGNNGDCGSFYPKQSLYYNNNNNFGPCAEYNNYPRKSHESRYPLGAEFFRPTGGGTIKPCDKKGGNFTQEKSQQNFPLQKGQNFPQHKGQNFPEQDGQNFSKQDGQNFPHQDGQNFPQQDGQNFPQQDGQDFPQQEVQNFPQQEVQNFPQPEVHNFPQEEVHNFPQEEVQNFPQPEVHNFPQEEVQNFQQPEVQNFPQQAVQNFPQQTVQNFPQPEVYTFPQPVPFQRNNMVVQQTGSVMPCGYFVPCATNGFDVSLTQQQFQVVNIGPEFRPGGGGYCSLQGQGFVTPNYQPLMVNPYLPLQF